MSKVQSSTAVDVTHTALIDFSPGEGPVVDDRYSSAGAVFQIDYVRGSIVNGRRTGYAVRGTNIKQDGTRGQRTSRYLDIPDDVKAQIDDALATLVAEHEAGK